MTYGFNLFNENGYQVFDGTNCLYNSSSGNCTKLAWSFDQNSGDPTRANKTNINTQGGANSLGQWYWLQNGAGNTYYYVYQCISNSYTQYQTSSNTKFIMNSSMDFDSIGFVNIPTDGILQMEHLNNLLPEFPSGSEFVVGSLYTGTLQYKLFTPTLQASTEQFGLQLFSEAGNLTFDSRTDILGVEFFEITQSQVQDILLNNSVIDLILSKAIPNAMVSSPMWLCFTANRTTSGCGRFVKITQPNDSTIRLSRQSVGPSNVCDNYYNFYSDLKLFVTRG